MPKKFTDEEYHRMLPKKQVGTAVLFFNSDDQLLILKPDYKDSWLVPGGSCDQGESPLHCAIRETKEEIGLNIPGLRLLGVLHSQGKGFYSDSLKFVYFGGKLTHKQCLGIRLQKEELTEYLFKEPALAVSLLSSSLQRSVPRCLEALKDNSVAYMEA